MTTMEAIVYLLYGFGVVMTTLALLWAATVLISKIVKAAGLDKMPAPKLAPSGLASVIPDETIAVVTAAVSFATGGKFAIKSINKK